jgi:hypothetical protein
MPHGTRKCELIVHYNQEIGTNMYLQSISANANASFTVVQSIATLIGTATNPHNLVKMPDLWIPYF